MSPTGVCELLQPVAPLEAARDAAAFPWRAARVDLLRRRRCRGALHGGMHPRRTCHAGGVKRNGQVFGLWRVCFSLHALLTRAEFVDPSEELLEITGHHKEASAETFFSLSMTSDCMPGSVVQYVHKFAYLFHSISQVVYYNFPTYNRQRQLPLADLQQTNVNAVNMLPLLTELRPDIPVFCEHTGAGCVDTHKQHKWSWVLWTHFVFLLDADMNVYAAKDLRSLLQLTGK